MKKLFAFVMTAALMLIGVQAFAQDIILKTDNTIIRANIEEINGENVVYHAYDNPDGPIFKLPISQIQSIQFKNGTEQKFNQAPANRFAQQVPVYSAPNYGQRLTRRGANLYLGTYQLDDNQIREIIGQDLWEETFVGARGQYSFGSAMELVGDAFLGFGIGGMISGLVANSSLGWTFAYIGFSGALTFFTIGIPFASIGNGRMNWVVEEANKRNGYAFQPKMNMGFAPHGLGLTVTF